MTTVNLLTTRHKALKELRPGAEVVEEEAGPGVGPTPTLRWGFVLLTQTLMTQAEGRDTFTPPTGCRSCTWRLCFFYFNRGKKDFLLHCVLERGEEVCRVIVSEQPVTSRAGLLVGAGAESSGRE